MGGLSIWHWLALLVVVGVLFGGRGKITNVMGDFAKGIKAFKQGMKEDETAQSDAPPKVTQQTTAGSTTPTGTEHAATDRT
jgi:sec-independent protein translocase protein TatA